MLQRQELTASTNQPATMRKMSKNRSRFNNKQIKSLETMFETVKLEPVKKLQLARELGLQPHQVAI